MFDTETAGISSSPSPSLSPFLLHAKRNLGVTIQAPQLSINTVAAGGGSRLFFRSGMFVVGPESAGAHPGMSMKQQRRHTRKKGRGESVEGRVSRGEGREERESLYVTTGPVCYRKNGHLAITDANLLLGRLLPSYFPKIFGPKEDQPLDEDATRKAFQNLTKEINTYLSK